MKIFKGKKNMYNFFKGNLKKKTPRESEVEVWIRTGIPWDLQEKRVRYETLGTKKNPFIYTFYSIHSSLITARSRGGLND